jgi:hypothetical protein
VEAMLVDVTSLSCERADADYINHRIDYFTAVKRCLYNITATEVEAIKICNDYHSYLVEGMNNKHLPSACASAISKFL